MIAKSTISQLEEIGVFDASVRDLQFPNFRAWSTQSMVWFIHG